MNVSPKGLFAGLAVALCTALSGACDQIVGDVESLPDLPPEIAATLDPATMATKIVSPIPPPQEASVVTSAPCCSTTDRKSLKVNFPHTKCGPLRDFIVGNIGDRVLFRSKQDTPQVYKLKAIAGKTLLQTHVCITSQGPWNATLEETRSCTNYSPRQTLIISAHDELISFVWNGGVEGHPPEVQLVTCREVGTVSFACGGLSTCECNSSSCPASAPCPCNLQW